MKARVLGDRLMAGQRTLTALIVVRIHVPQPKGHYRAFASLANTLIAQTASKVL